MLQLDKAITQQKLSLMRRYPWEILLVTIISWNILLTVEIRRLNSSKDKYLEKERENLMMLIQENTKVIEKNNFLFETLLKNR